MKEDKRKYQEMFRRFRCCVIMPTYNNGTFIGDLLDEVLLYCGDVFVVNDGSTDHTGEVLKRFNSVHVITLPKNRGKGEALKAGFRAALESDFDYAITMDSDTQHRPGDLPLFLDVLKDGSPILVIGTRLLSKKNVPLKNRWANRLSSFWYHIETGQKLLDTQSGFRLYPIRALQGTRLISRRYEYELEILVKSAWKGVEIAEIPIDVYYPPPGERVSHFRPLWDFLRISVLNTLLVIMGVFWFRPRKAIQKFQKKSFRQIWKEDIIGNDTPAHIIALSVAFGIFMGIVPVWGYQLVIGFFFAHLFKLNKAIFFITANISIPPMIPAILYLSYVTGSYVLGEGSWKVDIALNLQSIGLNLKQYLAGSIVFAIIAGLAAGALSYAFLILFKRVR